jgi:hypothetical protein
MRVGQHAADHDDTGHGRDGELGADTKLDLEHGHCFRLTRDMPFLCQLA